MRFTSSPDADARLAGVASSSYYSIPTSSLYLRRLRSPYRRAAGSRQGVRSLGRQLKYRVNAIDTTGPELVRVDPDGSGGLDGSTEEALGPLVRSCPAYAGTSGRLLQSRSIC